MITRINGDIREMEVELDLLTVRWYRTSRSNRATWLWWVDVCKVGDHALFSVFWDGGDKTLNFDLCWLPVSAIYRRRKRGAS